PRTEAQRQKLRSEAPIRGFLTSSCFLTGYRPKPRSGLSLARTPTKPRSFKTERGSFPPRSSCVAFPSRKFAPSRRRLVHRRTRSEEHTSELQSRFDLVCRLLLEKKN